MLTPAAPSLADWLTPGSPAIEQAIRRACSPGYESWWQRCASVGFCANPIQASAYDPDVARRVPMLIRCGNRRAAICPSCSDLYAADTWQLIHAGTHGGHHGMPDTTAGLPQVFATLTAPSFGAVHTSSRPGSADTVCHAAGSRNDYCQHGKPLWCNANHRSDDPEVGQPLCAQCYDYTGHVLFNWHAPELWRRFTIALRRGVSAHLRRIGVAPNVLRVSFVKVAEYQRRAVVHYHTLIRLDPAGDESQPAVSAIDLAALVRHAAHQVRLPVTADGPADTGVTPAPQTPQARMLRFGAQIDTQPLTATGDTTKPGLARRVAAYLAKYTTKSVTEFGIAARRISPAAIGELNIPAHTRRILSALAKLAALPGNAAMLSWLHTLGYRGHITTKSRRYSVTMTALRAARHHWRASRADNPEPFECQSDSRTEHRLSRIANELSDWRIDGAGLRDDGERLLVHTAARQARQHRCLARLEAHHITGASP
jgi:hypothetical protein